LLETALRCWSWQRLDWRRSDRIIHCRDGTGPGSLPAACRCGSVVGRASSPLHRGRQFDAADSGGLGSETSFEVSFHLIRSGPERVTIVTLLF